MPDILEARVAELAAENAYLRRRLVRALMYLEGSVANASAEEARGFAALVRRERPGLPDHD
jgi:hypothetical protein